MESSSFESSSKRSTHSSPSMARARSCVSDSVRASGNIMHAMSLHYGVNIRESGRVVMHQYGFAVTIM